jgi:hypothetical protein
MIGGLVLAVSAVTTYAALAALDVDFGGGTSAEVVAIEPSGNLLRTTNRDSLEACIDFINVDGQSREASVMAQNLTDVIVQEANDPAWLRDGLTNLGSTANVDVGCPAPPPPRTDLGTREPIGGLNAPNVEVPSKYLLFVFVMPDDEAAAFVGRAPWQSTSQEYLCAGDDCVGVTLGVYVGVNQASDPAKLRPIIRNAIAIRDSAATSGD